MYLDLNIERKSPRLKSLKDVHLETYYRPIAKCMKASYAREKINSCKPNKQIIIKLYRSYGPYI